MSAGKRFWSNVGWMVRAGVCARGLTLAEMSEPESTFVSAIVPAD